MDTGPQVGGGIHAVQGLYQSGEQIVAGHNSRAQMMTVGPKGGYCQENRHSRSQENAGFVVIAFVLEEKEYYHHCDIEKPQEVGNDKCLAKGDVIINLHMYDMVMRGNLLLQPTEPGQIEETVCDSRDGVSVFCK